MLVFEDTSEFVTFHFKQLLHQMIVLVHNQHRKGVIIKLKGRAKSVSCRLTF